MRISWPPIVVEINKALMEVIITIGKYELVSIQIYFDAYFGYEVQTLTIFTFIYFLAEILHRLHPMLQMSPISDPKNGVVLFYGTAMQFVRAHYHLWMQY